jgi:hypothetical protein
MTEQVQTQKPRITLTPLERTVINTPTKQEYTTLMRVYECGGWKWEEGVSPTYRGMPWDFSETICIRANDEPRYGFRDEYEDYTIILPEDFYEIQKVSLRQLLQINRWFEQNGNR